MLFWLANHTLRRTDKVRFYHLASWIYLYADVSNFVRRWMIQSLYNCGWIWSAHDGFHYIRTLEKCLQVEPYVETCQKIMSDFLSQLADNKAN